VAALISASWLVLNTCSLNAGRIGWISDTRAPLFLGLSCSASCAWIPHLGQYSLGLELGQGSAECHGLHQPAVGQYRKRPPCRLANFRRLAGVQRLHLNLTVGGSCGIMLFVG
jgi:hypothetical protein